MNADRPLIGIPLILILGAGLGVAYNALSTKPLPWITQAKAVVSLESLERTGSSSGEAPDHTPADGAGSHDPAPGTPPATTPDAETPPGSGATEDPGAASGIPESEFPITVSLAKTKELYDRGLLRVLDARDREDYEAGHIAGAESAPYDDVGGDPDWLETVAADPRPLLVYCDGGECELSINLGFALAQAGHRRVLVFEDGFPAWQNAGYPVTEGDAP